jgi:hypothetical protein
VQTALLRRLDRGWHRGRTPRLAAASNVADCTDSSRVGGSTHDGPRIASLPAREGFANSYASSRITFETAFLRPIYVLFFISLATRRIEYIACSANPDGCWTTQQARNLLMQLGDKQPFWFLIHDRDTKLSRSSTRSSAPKASK